MWKKLLFVMFSLVCSVASASENNDNMTLTFGAAGEFKVLNLSNCTDSNGSMSQATRGFVSRLIDTEDPQLVVFTIGQHGMKDAQKVLSSLTALSKNKPCVAVYADGETGTALPIMTRDGSKVSHVVYLMGEAPSFDQVAWYRQQSRKFTNQNAGVPVPSIAFVVKPLQEFDEGYKEYGDQEKIKKLYSHTGSKGEAISYTKPNYGLFTSMHECGDIRGVFAGYDNDNDFALVWKNIMLGYGRHTCTEGSMLPGARVIILKESEESILTYIRDEDNKVIDRCVFPDDFPVTK